MDIYTLTSQYKNEVATETNASLRSCELLYQIKLSALARADTKDEHNKQYQKQIAEIRKECNLSKAQFNKDVAVGAALQRADSNEMRMMTKRAIYTKYCTTSKTSKPKESKIDYKNKYEQQLKMIEYIRDKMGIDAWNKFLSKYHSSSSNTAAMVED